MNMKRRTVLLFMLVAFAVVLWFIDIEKDLVYESSSPMYTLIPYNGMLDLDRQSVMIQSGELPDVKVTDSYTLTNPLDEHATVSLMLPVQNDGTDADGIKIRLGGMEQDYSIKWLKDSSKYNAALEENKDGIDVKAVAEDLRKELGFVYKNIVPADKIWVYEVELEDEDNKIKIENKSGDLSILYMKPVNDSFKVQTSRQSAEFTLDRGGESKYSIALLNGQDDEIKFESSGDYRKKEMRLSEYVRQCVNRYMAEHSEMKSSHLNVVREVVPHVMFSVDAVLGQKKSAIIDLNDMFANYVDIISFDVEFEPGETKTVEISYTLRGIYDKTRLENPIYTYRLKISPVDSWTTCGHTMISVLVKNECKYMIESSVPFDYQSYTNKYTAVMDTAPDEIVSYSLYDSQVNMLSEINIGVKNRINAASIGFAMFIVISAVMAFASRKRHID